MQINDLNGIISDPRFSVQSLSEAIINWPPQFGLLGNWEGLFGEPLFAESGISETFVKVDVKGKDLNIIPSTPRGAPGIKDTSDTRSVKVLPTFRYQQDAYLLADEFQNVRAFGTDNSFDPFADRLSEKQFDLHRKNLITTEYLRWGALRGIVYDADGVTQLYNTYTFMGETQQSIDWNLGAAAGTDPIQNGTNQLMDYLTLQGGGEPISGVVIVMSPGLHQKLMLNADFREAFRYFGENAGVNPNRQNLHQPFFFKGVWYLRHIGQATYVAPDGTQSTHTFITPGEGIAIPLGTRTTFRTYYAPADRLETVNTIGLPMYSWIDVMKGNKGIEVYSQTNPLNMVLKPRLVVRVFSST